MRDNNQSATITLMIVVIDIGATKTQISFSFTGEEFEDSIIFPTNQNQRKVISEIVTKTHALIGHRTIDLVAVCAPAAINTSKGSITKMHNLDWKNLLITKPLSKHFSAPAILCHDGSAAAIAESRIGASKIYRLAAYITLSTGLGGAITLDGNLLPTPNNQEIGDQIIEKSQLNRASAGRLSGFASGRALDKRFNLNGTKETITKKNWEIISFEIAVGIHNVIQIVSPQVVVLGGGISNHYNSFIKPLQNHLGSFDSLYSIPPIVQAKFVNNTPSVGMLLLANEYLS